VEIIARFTRHLRESTAVDQRSGVSARFSIAAAETVAAAALHRGRDLRASPIAVARVVDLPVPLSTCCAARWSSSPARRAASRPILEHLLRTRDGRRRREKPRRARLAAAGRALGAGGVLVMTGDRSAPR
jgi:magnesium chelatase subunit I